MAKVKLDLRNKTDSELLSFAQAHVAAMTGNADFPTPQPSTADFATTLASYATALATSGQAQAAAEAATAAKDDARSVLELALTTRGNYVENTSGGEEAKILSTALQVRAQAAPIGDLAAPIDFLATMGDMPGEINLTWSAVRGARSYVVDCREEPGTAWSQAKIVTRSKATVAGLTTGKTYAFRVRAVGAAGDGPWSDLSIKLAP